MLEISLSYSDSCQCNVILSGERIISSQNLECGQLPLPFKKRVYAEKYGREVEEIIKTVWPQIRQLPLRRKMLLELCIKGGRPARELFRDCPALGLLLALRISNDSSICLQEQLVELAGRKRVEILEYCLFPAAPWIVKLLRKITPAQCSPFILQDLKKILTRNTSKQIKVLRHLPAVSRLVVDTLKDEKKAALVANSFYVDAATSRWSGDAEYLFDEIIRMKSDEVAGDYISVPPLRSVDDLPRAHDELVRQFNNLERLEWSGFLSLTFPKPPFAGISGKTGNIEWGIFPIRTGMELYTEGQEMKHCVATYASSIAYEKNLYVYHVCSPAGEKATLMLSREDVFWHLSEIEGVANTDVSSETMQWVEEWIAGENRFLRKKYGLEKREKNDIKAGTDHSHDHGGYSSEQHDPPDGSHQFVM